MILLWLVAGHFLGDFAFQSDWMTKRKGESWEAMAYHTLVHAAAVLVVTKIGGFELSYLALVLLVGLHFFVDPLKSRWKIVKSIWLDQILHIAILVMIAFLGFYK